MTRAWCERENRKMEDEKLKSEAYRDKNTKIVVSDLMGAFLYCVNVTQRYVSYIGCEMRRASGRKQWWQ